MTEITVLRAQKHRVGAAMIILWWDGCNGLYHAHDCVVRVPVWRTQPAVLQVRVVLSRCKVCRSTSAIVVGVVTDYFG